jgi:uncharacterized membrane protein (DUF373 family)
VSNGTGEQGTTTATATATALAERDDDPPAPKERRARETALTWALERFDALVYGIVGGIFCLAALLSLAYGLYAFISQVQGQVQGASGFTPQTLTLNGAGAQDVISLVSDLLLTLIIMEVLGTVVYYLRQRETTLRPFLFIGIISATRGILAVGARLSVSGSLKTEEFIKAMVELGVNAAVIIALGVALRLIGPYLDEGANARRGRSKSK